MNAPSYTLRAAGASSTTAISFNYAVGGSAQHMFIMIMPYGGVTLSLPAGCNVIAQVSCNSQPTIAACSGHGPGTYTVTSSGSATNGNSWAAYSVN